MKVIKRNQHGQMIGPPMVVAHQEDLPALIQRFYRLVGRSLQDLETAEAMGTKEINALVNLGKLLPQLEQAELTRQTKINKRNIKDLTTAELKNMAQKYLKQDLTAVPEPEAESPEAEEEDVDD